MNGLKAMTSSNTDRWATPRWLFEMLDREFHFDLDPCADDENHVCDTWYGREQDGLSKNWGGCSVFCNPPYGRGMERWLRKCCEESKAPGTVVVALIPARTGARWFREWVAGKAELRFVSGRLQYGDSGVNAPFDSVVCVYGTGAVTDLKMIRRISNNDRAESGISVYSKAGPARG